MSELIGIARFRFHEGRVEEFERLSAQCKQIVRDEEPGTLQYVTYFNDDRSECIVVERYRDEQALLDHSAHMAPFMDAILATATVVGELLGDVSPGLRANFSDDGPVRLFRHVLEG